MLPVTLRARTRWRALAGALRVLGTLSTRAASSVPAALCALSILTAGSPAWAQAQQMPTTRLEALQVIAAPGANMDTATAIDIVFVYRPDALPLLPKTGPEWFANKAALLAAFGASLEVVPLQLAPGYMVQVTLPPRHASAIAVYAYANMISPAGQPVGNLTPYRHVQMRIESDRIGYYTAP
jgi:type VI secretion system protein